MAPKFRVPKCLEDLMELPADDEDTLHARDVVDIDSLDASEMHRLVAGVVAELADREVFCVQEQSVFDQLYSLVRGYAHLDVSTKSILIDSLCTNFVELNVSTSVLISSIDQPTNDCLQQCRVHCNAVRIYAYFLSSVLVAEESEPEPAAGKSSGSRGGSKGRSRKKHVPEDWDWSSLRTRCLKVLAGALQNNLKKIFESSQVDETLITFVAKAAFKMFENRALLEKGDTKQPLCTIIAVCSIQYGYGISSVVTIIDLLHKFDHLPTHMADLVASAENQFNGSSLAVDLLRAIGKIDPANFERDSTGAENVGLFLEELAARLPKVMVTNLSVIHCHLDGKSYKMRNSVVKLIGRLIVAVKERAEICQNDVSHLRVQQSLLSVLVERVRDVSAHTRKHVLQTWAHLCQEHAVPIGHYNLVADIAAGRLEDSAAIVRKNALQLLCALLSYNPYGQNLREAKFEATFEKVREKLSGMSPPSEPDGEGVGQEQQEAEGNLSPDKSVEAATTQSSEGVPSEGNGTEAGSLTDSQPGDGSPQAQPSPSGSLPSVGSIEHTRTMVASLESALRFSRCIGSAVHVVSGMLASSTIGDVESSIQLLILCKKFDIDGAGFGLRKTLPLVFSQELGIRSAVEDAFKTLYLQGEPAEAASNLINLTLEASLGDLTSIEELVCKAMSRGEISGGTVAALWNSFTFIARGSTAGRSRAALTVLCMAAKAAPHLLSSHLQNILDIGFGRWAKDDVLLARCACIALQRLPASDKANFKRTHKLFSTLSNLIVAPGLSEACWYSASEQAINAIYALHPAPESFASGLLLKLAQAVFSRSRRSASVGPDGQGGDGAGDEDAAQGDDGFSSVSAVAASRFLFAVAHVALKHLVYIESCLKLIRKQRHDKEMEKANHSAEESAAADGAPPSQEGNIAAELGLAASEDARLDDLLEQAEAEIVRGDSTRRFLVGAIAPMVSKLCSNSALMQQSPQLQSSALLALCKLMVIDAAFCERHLQLLFTVAQNSLEDSVRSNCVVALGDLALRFPNLVEPWMESMYARVHDQSVSVRKNAVLVLSHLILNDLIKVKGYISEMAIHIEDADSRISDSVKLFFHELSKKGNNPINNLLPDILSRLSGHPELSQVDFNSVMQFLIGEIKKSKQMEGLIEKFCNRFVGISDARQWQDIAFCLCQLNYTQSCLKRLADLFKVYQHALGDAGVLAHFKSLIVKTRKLAPAEVKLLLDELEEKIMSCHNEIREQEDAAQKALEHHGRLKAQSTEELGSSRTPSQGDELETQTLEEDVVLNGEQKEDLEIQTAVDETVVNGEDSDMLETQTVQIKAAVNDEQSGNVETHTVNEDTVVNGEQTEELEAHTSNEDTLASREQNNGVETQTSEEATVVKREESDELGAQTEEGIVVNEEQTVPTRTETLVVVKAEVFDEVSPLQNSAMSILPDTVEGDDEIRSEIEATASVSAQAQEESDGEVSDGEASSEVDDRESSAAEHGAQNVGHGDSGELNRAGLTSTPGGPSRLRTEKLDAPRLTAERAPSRRNPAWEESAVDSIDEETGGTQPYPYMDLDFESAPTQERPQTASTVETVRVKEEIMDDSSDLSGLSVDVGNGESLYGAKENPFASGYGRDRIQMTNSPFASNPPSLESPQPVRTISRRRLEKGDANFQRAGKSFSVARVKQERSPQHERGVDKSRVLRALNEKGS